MQRPRGDDDRKAAVPAAPTHVLVADDDDEMRRTLAAALRRDGYVVTEASDGDDVVDHVRLSNLCVESGPPLDAVVSDIRMPGPSGLGVLMAVRAVAPALPVVLITAFGDAELHAEARARGADAVLDKPFDLDELRAALRKLAPPA
ncbi:MAG: response regulator [Deltaproteobacteria bacterium]|nr:response regulator [Deltaproteobacteria bacterium]